MDGFGLTEKQAQAILDLRLQRLTGLEREKIEEEYQEILKTIAYLQGVLADEGKIFGIIKEELTKVKEQYGDDRRTRITLSGADMDIEDLIAEEDVVITVTHGGYVKRMPLTTYRNQKRGGRGVTGMGTKETDFVEHLLITTTHHTIMFFTNRGLVYRLKGYDIPEATRQAKGTAIVNLLPLASGETITAVIPIREYREDRFLFMATKKGIVKKTVLKEYDTARKGGLIALTLDEDDELIGVRFTDGERRIILGTRDGLAIMFEEDDVRSMGRQARGVHGIRLNDMDEVVGMDTVKDDSEVLTVTEEGYGKRTAATEYRVQQRGGKGVINMKVTEKTGAVVGLKVVTPNQELMLITQEGIVIRTNVDEISVISRNTQGVTLMKTETGDRVASLAVMDQKSE